MQIESLNGLSVETSNKRERIVYYNGQECPLINREENRCNMGLIDTWETYKTPIGIVERHWCQMDVEWRLIPMKKIRAVQKRFQKASIELVAVRFALEMVTPT